MIYFIKSGKFYDNVHKDELFTIQGEREVNRKIISPSGEQVRLVKLIRENHRLSFEIYDEENQKIGECHPNYLRDSYSEDKKDTILSANITCKNQEFFLKTITEKKYQLFDKDHKRLVKIHHCAVDGGWNIYDYGVLSEVQICVFFTLCRFLEKEKNDIKYQNIKKKR